MWPGVKPSTGSPTNQSSMRSGGAVSPTCNLASLLSAPDAAVKPDRHGPIPKVAHRLTADVRSTPIDRHVLPKGTRNTMAVGGCHIGQGGCIAVINGEPILDFRGGGRLALGRWDTHRTTCADDNPPMFQVIRSPTGTNRRSTAGQLAFRFSLPRVAWVEWSWLNGSL